MRYKIIFKKDIALKLRDMGNPIMDADVNLKHPKFVIYYFEDTDKLQIFYCLNLLWRLRLDSPSLLIVKLIVF